MNNWIDEHFLEVAPALLRSMLFHNAGIRDDGLAPLCKEFLDTLNRHGANLSEAYKDTLLKRFHQYLDAYDFDEETEISMRMA